MPSTTASWARPVKSFEEIPHSFKEYISQSEPLPYSIYSPSDHWGKKQTNAKLTCMYQDRIVILEVLENKVNEICYLFKDINYIEQGTILLYSWVSIHGFADGKLSVSILEYNSVVAVYFHPLVTAIRQSHFISNKIGDNQKLSKLDYLNRLNYKFFNYSHDAILPREEVMGTVYQPAIYEKFILLFTRVVNLGHLTILTDQELIIIKEELTEEKRKSNANNGGVWVYIPLHKIVSITINNKRKNVINLVIGVQGKDIYLSLSLNKRLELEALIEGFKTAKFNDVNTR